MLAGIEGGLGVGKTQTLTFLVNHFKKYYNEPVFANYKLLNIDYKYIATIEDIKNIRRGKFYADELWLWLDSRISSFDEYNKEISNILLKSRKRFYDVFYTAQGLHQIDKRIRLITDFILQPEILYYDEDNYCLNQIEQDFLYPIDLKPYLNNLVINVDVCKPIDEFNLSVVSSFSYWMKDIIPLYDTTEEIEDIRNLKGIHKGIYVEGKFLTVLKTLFPDAIITQSVNSGQYQTTLDIELLEKGNLYLFDVCTVAKRKVQGYEYNYLDNREKDYNKILEIGKIRNGLLFFAFILDDKWYILPIKDNNKFKDMINISHVKDDMIEIKKWSKGILKNE